MASEKDRVHRTERHTETVDEYVISVILPKSMYLTRLGAKGMTVEEEHNLDR